MIQSFWSGLGHRAICPFQTCRGSSLREVLSWVPNSDDARWLLFTKTTDSFRQHAPTSSEKVGDSISGVFNTLTDSLEGYG